MVLSGLKKRWKEREKIEFCTLSWSCAYFHEFASIVTAKQSFIIHRENNIPNSPGSLKCIRIFNHNLCFDELLLTRMNHYSVSFDCVNHSLTASIFELQHLFDVKNEYYASSWQHHSSSVIIQMCLWGQQRILNNWHCPQKCPKFQRNCAWF